MQAEPKTREEWIAEGSTAFSTEQVAYEEWIDQRSLVHIADEELLEEMSGKFLPSKLYCNEFERYREYYEYNYCDPDYDEKFRDKDEIYEEIYNSWSSIFIKI